MWWNVLTNDWDEKLDACVLAYRKTPHSATGESPFFLEHGRDPITPAASTLPPNPTDADAYKTALLTTLHHTLEESRKSIERTQKAQDRRLSAKQKPIVFNKGDLVWYHRNQVHGSRKFFWPWKGPARVVHVFNPQSYEIVDLEDTSKPFSINIRRLRPYVTPRLPQKQSDSVYIPNARLHCSPFVGSSEPFSPSVSAPDPLSPDESSLDESSDSQPDTDDSSDDDSTTDGSSADDSSTADSSVADSSTPSSDTSTSSAVVDPLESELKRRTNEIWEFVESLEQKRTALGKKTTRGFQQQVSSLYWPRFKSTTKMNNLTSALTSASTLEDKVACVKNWLQTLTTNDLRK